MRATYAILAGVVAAGAAIPAMAAEWYWDSYGSDHENTTQDMTAADGTTGTMTNDPTGQKSITGNYSAQQPVVVVEQASGSGMSGCIGYQGGTRPPDPTGFIGLEFVNAHCWVPEDELDNLEINGVSVLPDGSIGVDTGSTRYAIMIEEPPNAWYQGTQWYYGFADAGIDFCANGTWHGHSDWFLPSASQLGAIIGNPSQADALHAILKAVDGRKGLLDYSNAVAFRSSSETSYPYYQSINPEITTDSNTGVRSVSIDTSYNYANGAHMCVRRY